MIIELYVELYFYLFRLFKNEHVAGWLDILLLSFLQLLNIYSIIVVIQKLLTIDVTGYLFHQVFIIIFLCGIAILLNFFTSKEAKKTLKKEDSFLFISRRFTAYLILTIILLVAAHYIPK
jgi:hypothetical protein